MCFQKKLRQSTLKLFVSDEHEILADPKMTSIKGIKKSHLMALNNKSKPDPVMPILNYQNETSLACSPRDIQG